jgi:acyl-coenzyme A thioesterase PaaI-like protein
MHGGYAAILPDAAMGLAVHTALPAGAGYTTLEFKITTQKAGCSRMRPRRVWFSRFQRERDALTTV